MLEIHECEFNFPNISILVQVTELEFTVSLRHFFPIIVPQHFPGPCIKLIVKTGLIRRSSVVGGSRVWARPSGIA